MNGNYMNDNQGQPMPMSPGQNFMMQPPMPPKPQKVKREYKAHEIFFAWFTFFLGFLFCRAFPVTIKPLGGFIIVWLAFVAVAIFLVAKRQKPGVMPICVVIGALVMSPALLISANSFLHFFTYGYAIAAFCYFIYAVFGNTVTTAFSDMLAADFFRALFVLPYCSLVEFFRAAFYGRAGKGGKAIAKALLGIAVAVIPTFIIFILLSYDSEFIKLIVRIFSFDWWDVLSWVISLIFAVPIAMYIFGLYVSSADNKAKDVVTEDECKSAWKKIKFAPAVTVFAAVIPILVLYVIFFISQWGYYMSCFSGVLPEGINYADYAREGFFQLCIISGLNLVIILIVSAFMKRGEGGKSVSLKVISLLYSVATLILIATAVAKMVMYIDVYGLTPKRVYALFMIAVYAALFILIILKQFFPGIKAVAVSFFICVVMFSCLALSNIDERIAEYNIDRYFDGSLTSVDTYALYQLGDSAVPEMVRLYETLRNKKDRTDLEEDIYQDMKFRLKWMIYDITDPDKSIFAFNIPHMKALGAVTPIIDGNGELIE
ncbi:MAG: DUF4173 domain-containing protein [Clostridia bacterium]|nr:DUF4173 domain-containing protein [Clostridia bacterium]